jgi:hypothetical protein
MLLTIFSIMADTVASGKGRQVVGAEFLRKESDSIIHYTLHFSIIKTRDCKKPHVAWTFALG